MRALSPVRTATRSAAISRRAGVVVLATALVAAPLAAVSPAFADASVVTGATFTETEVAVDRTAQGIFTDSADQFFAPGFDACMFEYRNGTPLPSNSIATIATATAPYANGPELAAAGFVAGDTYTVAYADATANADGSVLCVAPALTTAGLVQASIALVEAVPVAPSIPLSAPDVKLTRGVAVDQDIPFTTAGLDFTASGGYIGFGPQSANEPAPGYIDPYTGLKVTILDEGTPGVVPRIHIAGTPTYSSVIKTGFFIVDGENTGEASLNIVIADKDGSITPITIDAANGAAVAGAKVVLITSGLQAGSGWNATVRSTPIVVGSGVIDASGTLSTTVAIPAGLAPGLHSITLAGTNADGSPFSSVVYFSVSATGTLLAVSAVRATALAALPQLAATGQDVAPSLFVAGGLLLAGAAFAGVTVIRRRRSA
ncbi:hypothetical protein [Conyzicola sp.]|uniref:hypothetical protein n=1 Tax=Conyzicola sp. TaxID=1969404 RepID=UPI003989DEEE